MSDNRFRSPSECCGDCRWHKKDNRRADYNGDWVCDNPDSDNYTDWTDYSYHCPEWEGRK